MNSIERDLLLAVADLHQVPSGAYNIRQNGKAIDRHTTKDIDIVTKEDRAGIDIFVKSGTINQSLHIPVIITESGIKDMVYNDFYIGDNCDILIVAGCGIHNPSSETSEHNGIHSFHIGKNSKVRYVEKHIGSGATGDKILNPVTIINMEEQSQLTMETVQLGGVTYSDRDTKALLKDKAKLIIQEKIMTSQDQQAKTKFDVCLEGVDSSVDVISRSVARDNSYQSFYSKVTGNNRCFGHVECDAILMDNSHIVSTPEIDAKCVDATLVHEAAIGKIAGDQLIKLKTLGLTDKEAEDMIINGFLS